MRRPKQQKPARGPLAYICRPCPPYKPPCSLKYLKIDKKILKGYYDDGKDIELILDLIKASKGRTSVMKNQGIDGLVFPVQHPLVGFIREIPEDDVEAWLKQEKEAVKHIIAAIKNIQFGKLVGFKKMIGF